MVPESADVGKEISNNSSATATNNDQQHKIASMTKPESETILGGKVESIKVTGSDEKTVTSGESYSKITGVIVGKPEKKEKNPCENENNGSSTSSEEPPLRNNTKVNTEMEQDVSKENSDNSSSKIITQNISENSFKNGGQQEEKNSSRRSSPLLLEDDELLKTDEVLPPYDFGPKNPSDSKQMPWVLSSLPYHIKFLASKVTKPIPTIQKVVMPASPDRNENQRKDTEPVVPGTERSILRERRQERLASKARRGAKKTSGDTERVPPGSQHRSAHPKDTSTQKNSDILQQQQQRAQNRPATAHSVSQSLPTYQSKIARPPHQAQPQASTSRSLATSHNQRLSSSPPQLCPASVSQTPSAAPTQLPAPGFTSQSPRPTSNQLPAAPAPKPTSAPPGRQSQQSINQNHHPSAPAQQQHAYAPPGYYSGRHHYGYAYPPAPPQASSKPIRRLAKIRPYANQAIPVSAEEIRQAIPEDSSAVFHVMDRRVNLDAFELDETAVDVKVPVYSLLRAWVQDDPYRQIPTQPSLLPEMATERQEDWNNVGRKRDRMDIDIDNENSNHQERKHKANADVAGYLQKTLSSQAKLPSIDSMKQEMIHEAREKKMGAKKIYKQKLAETLKRLQERGVIQC